MTKLSELNYTQTCIQDQGRHFNFFIIGAKIFVGHFKSLPGHKTFFLGGGGMRASEKKIVEYLYSLFG